MSMMIRLIKYRFSKMELPVPAYLKNTHLFALQTKLISKQNQLYEFQDSIFHLQGGGQPNDKGWLIHKQKQYQILGGVSNRQTGKLQYKLPEDAQLEVGDQVVMQIDPAIRILHAKIHSAGHILDLAVHRLKYGWQPSKGYHFADGPYVEYKAVPANAQQQTKQLNQILKIILTQKIPAQTKIMGYGQAVQKKLIEQNFKTSFVRLVSFDDSECPCGGTHVSTDEIKQITVLKIQKKGKNLRVFYKVE